MPANANVSPDTSAAAVRPRLVVFGDQSSGPCRRTDAHLAQVLQRRCNHETFAIVRVDCTQRPDLAERYLISRVPTLVVVVGRRVQARIVQPRSALEIKRALAPWLR
ncbi:MAG: thioredoxin family protein [Gaiellaceae bacterium]